MCKFHLNYRISASNAICAPLTWQQGDPRRPYPTDIEMRLGMLGRLGDPINGHMLQQQSSMSDLHRAGHPGGINFPFMLTCFQCFKLMQIYQHRIRTNLLGIHLVRCILVWVKGQYQWTLETISRRMKMLRLCPRIQAVARQATLNSILRKMLASYCKMFFIFTLLGQT